jgi:hypothetical protein
MVYPIFLINLFFILNQINIMSFKFNWGHGIMLFLGIYIVFIMSFVYKTLFISDYDHVLVANEYYNDANNYQKEIDKMNNASQLKENVKLVATDQGIEVVFPNFLDPKKITGFVDLQRSNDIKLDLKKEIKLDTLILLIPADQLKKGVYTVKVVWEYEKIPYQLNEKFTYK